MFDGEKRPEIKMILIDKKRLKIVESNNFDIFTGIYQERIWYEILKIINDEDKRKIEHNLY